MKLFGVNFVILYMFSVMRVRFGSLILKISNDSAGEGAANAMREREREQWMRIKKEKKIRRRDKEKAEEQRNCPY